MAASSAAAAGGAVGWLSPTGLPDPAALAELTSEMRKARPAGAPFEVIVDILLAMTPRRGPRAGATWTVTDFGMQPTQARVLEVIDAGPR